METVTEDLNPYALIERQLPPDVEWSLFGSGILVRDGTTLPQVDLETGETGEGMVRQTTVHERMTFLSHVKHIAFSIILIVTFVAWRHLGYGLLSLLAAMVAASGWKRFQASRGRPNDHYTVIHDFISARRKKARTFRRVGQSVILITGLGFAFAPGGGLVFPVLLCSFAISLWELACRPKAGISTEPGKFVRISPVHPDALAYLKTLEQPRGPQ